MKIIKPEICHKDERGSITDILYKTPVDHVTFIDISKGSVRGNHYHKETIQYIFVLDGSILYRTRTPDGQIIDTVINQGDLLLTEILEAHAMQALADSKFMVFTKGPRGGKEYEIDTFRLDDPIL